VVGRSPIAENKTKMCAQAKAGSGTGAEIESAYAWLRLATALTLGTIGSIGMWSFVVALPSVQAGFGVASSFLVLHRALPDLQRMKPCYSAAASSAPRSVFPWCD
jgi:hypothetical protein